MTHRILSGVDTYTSQSDAVAVLRRLPLLIITAVSLAFPATAHATSYLTVQMGRAQWAQVKNRTACSPEAGSVTLDQVVGTLASYGLTPTMVVQTSTAGTTAPVCDPSAEYATWPQLQWLRQEYGVTAVSAGDTLAHFDTMADADVIQHSCGTLPAFASNGFETAWGEFAFPDNVFTAQDEKDVTGCGFAYARRYNSKYNPLPVASPYTVWAYSLTGGRCNDPAAACSSMTVPNNQVYPDPQSIISFINGVPDNAWVILQPYRFVTGTGPTWDCSSADWHDHWTSEPESFCWNDFQTILAGLRSDLVSADPAAIASLTDRTTRTTTPPPLLTVTMSRSEISAADQMVGREPTGTCVRDDRDIAPLDTQVLPWMAANTPLVHLTGSVETAVTPDSSNWCAHGGESLGPSWSQLQSFGAQYGMRFISHSADYPLSWNTAPKSWTGSLADWQRYETCGSRDAITAHGLLGADGQFDWPDQQVDQTVLATDVEPCFDFNRTYQGVGVNTLAAVQASQNQASTRQLLGGHCNVTGLPCSTVLSWGYTVPRSVITQIQNLQPGQDLNLQAYVLVRNTNPAYATNQDQWDCTDPNPAYHWTNDVERYCWSDFKRIVQFLQSDPNVVVTDPKGVAVAWGMRSPEA
jgi:hypothetical protein